MLAKYEILGIQILLKEFMKTSRTEIELFEKIYKIALILSLPQYKVLDYIKEYFKTDKKKNGFSDYLFRYRKHHIKRLKKEIKI